MKHDLFENDYMVIRMYNGKKLANIHFDDENNIFEVEPILDEYYDYYEDEYNDYAREDY